MLKKQLLILFIIFWSQHSSCSPEAVAVLEQLTGKIIAKMNAIKSLYDTGSAIASIFINPDNHDQTIPTTLGIINDKMDDLRAYTRDRDNYIDQLIKQLPSKIDANAKKEKIVSFIVATNDLWDQFIWIARNKCSNDKLTDFVNVILKKLREELPQFRNTLTSSSHTQSIDEGLYMLILNNAQEERDSLCDRGETSHHSVIRLFHVVILTEIKAHILLHFANIYQFPDDEWTRQLEKNFVDQFNTSIRVLSNGFRTMKLPYIRKCEPEAWHRGDDFYEANFYEFEGLFQQTVYFEPTSCNVQRLQYRKFLCERVSRGGLDDVHPEKHCVIRPFNEHTKCNHVPRNCTLLDPQREATIVRPWSEGLYRIRCVSVNGKVATTDTRDSCSSGNDRYYSNHKSGFACSCQCTDIRVKIMMNLTNSNIFENYIVVGLRINKLRDYIYIQIAEGQLEANGFISGFSWVKSTRSIRPEWGYNYPVPSTYKHDHLFFFEDLQLAPGHVLIGAQFSRLYRNDVIGYGITIIGMKYDYKTGKLRKKQRSYGRVVYHTGPRILQSPGKNPISMKMSEYARPNSDGFTHVYLRQSDLDHDFGQSTLPLLDAVPIMTDPLTPIGGVGLFHKEFVSYGGVLSLRLFPINFTHYLETFRELNDLSSLLNPNN